MCLEIHTYNVVVQDKESLYDNFDFFLSMMHGCHLISKKPKLDHIKGKV